MVSFSQSTNSSDSMKVSYEQSQKHMNDETFTRVNLESIANAYRYNKYNDAFNTEHTTKGLLVFQEISNLNLNKYQDYKKFIALCFVIARGLLKNNMHNALNKTKSKKADVIADTWSKLLEDFEIISSINEKKEGKIEDANGEVLDGEIPDYVKFEVLRYILLEGSNRRLYLSGLNPHSQSIIMKVYKNRDIRYTPSSLKH